jgi:hypothetical protein
VMLVVRVVHFDVLAYGGFANPVKMSDEVH